MKAIITLLRLLALCALVWGGFYFFHLCANVDRAETIAINGISLPGIGFVDVCWRQGAAAIIDIAVICTYLGYLIDKIPVPKDDKK